jgi:hypothetical protein
LLSSRSNMFPHPSITSASQHCASSFLAAPDQ